MLVGSGLVAGAGYAETRGSIPARNCLVTSGVAAALAGVLMRLEAQPYAYACLSASLEPLRRRLSIASLC